MWNYTEEEGSELSSFHIEPGWKLKNDDGVKG